MAKEDLAVQGNSEEETRDDTSRIVIRVFLRPTSDMTMAQADKNYVDVEMKDLGVANAQVINQSSRDGSGSVYFVDTWGLVTSIPFYDVKCIRVVKL